MKNTEKYIEAIGRRKTSTARVRIFPASKTSFIVNEKDAKDFFQTEETRHLVFGPLSADIFSEEGKIAPKLAIQVIVSGGGAHSQAEAVRHGLSRALVKYDIELRKNLKSSGYLKRDARMKERRKFGLKKARKAPKWSKR